MFYIFVALLLNNQILINYSNNNDIIIPNLKEILEIVETNDIMDVDKIVKKYMLKYGIDRVRGGSYKNDILEEWQIKSLEHELKLLKYDDTVSKKDELNKFANSYNNETIDNIISEIITFRNRLLKLKNMNELTDFNFNFDNIIIAINKNEELEKLRIEFQKYNTMRGQHFDSITRDKLIKMEQNINELNEEIKQLCGKYYHINEIFNQINYHYNNYIKFKDISNPIENNIIIKLYSIKIFNTEIKQKIQNFKSPYGSTEEEILEKYQALLKRKLHLITV